jgi:hypothetical protein
MNITVKTPEISVRPRRSDFVAASPDKVGPNGRMFHDFMKHSG